MTTRRTSVNRNETFGRLLSGAINSIATYEGKTAPIVEEELGALMHVVGKSVQRYKAGHLPPEETQIKVLAEAAVRRGFLGREWLQRFLHAARYPFADKLLDQLCPVGPARPRPPRVYENLPAPTYSQFVMREQAFADVLDGLQQRSAVVLIVGLGGNGKTSLAREVAAACLVDDSATSHFDAVVWVSDKDKPGTTNLSTVLDEVAHTLDYPGFTQFEYDEKRREVEQLLRRQRVLLVVDNFETVTDGALLNWLLRLPEPSKAIVTTREYRREFRRGGWPIDLRGMRDAEVHALIDERLHVLKMQQLIEDRSQLEPLIIVTGGNPKAIEIALGLVKYERRPLQQIVDDLYAARSELFDDLFARAWSLLDEAARRVLLVMTFFSTSAISEALITTADIQAFVFDRAIERITDLALIDVEQETITSSPRYTLHPLVRAFTEAKFLKQQEFEQASRKRWLEWYIQLVSQVGYCFSELWLLNKLDSEHKTIYSAIVWSNEMKYHEQTALLVSGSGYYYYVRGAWDKIMSINMIGLQAASYLGSIADEVLYLSFITQMFIRQGNLSQAKIYLDTMQKYLPLRYISENTVYDFYHAHVLYWNALGKREYAYELVKELKFTEFRNQLAAEGWLADYLYSIGSYSEAHQVIIQTLEEALKHGENRAITSTRIRLVTIELDLNDIEVAERRLFDIRERAYTYQDRRYIAIIARIYARLHILRGNIPAARISLIEAIDLFERLGARHDLAEAHQALTDLETSEAPAA